MVLEIRQLIFRSTESHDPGLVVLIFDKEPLPSLPAVPGHIASDMRSVLTYDLAS